MGALEAIRTSEPTISINQPCPARFWSARPWWVLRGAVVLGPPRASLLCRQAGKAQGYTVESASVLPLDVGWPSCQRAELQLEQGVWLHFQHSRSHGKPGNAEVAQYPPGTGFSMMLSAELYFCLDTGLSWPGTRLGGHWPETP